MSPPCGGADSPPAVNGEQGGDEQMQGNAEREEEKEGVRRRKPQAPAGLQAPPDGSKTYEAFQDLAAGLSTQANKLSAKAHEISDSLFGHMLTAEAAASPAMSRQRALTGLVDVLADRHIAGRLKKRWVLAAMLVTFGYLRYVLPAVACWGSSHWARSVEPSEFTETVGSHNSHVSFGVLVVVSLGYLSMLQCSSRLMEARLPIRHSIFEILVVYNMTQMLLNAYVCAQLLREAWLQGFRSPWGNLFVYTEVSHRLGFYIWLHYHCCQLEILDTLFVVIRKKFQKITLLHVSLRLLNMWTWYIACRYACGGDTYFPAAVNAATRAAVYACYSISLLLARGMPFMRKAYVIELQICQFAVCACHALFCMYNFWNMNIPRAVLVLYFLVMAVGLLLYTDFHSQAEGKSVRKVDPQRKAQISIAFDSSGWLYAYHFGVATWVREHFIPEDLNAENVNEKFPDYLACSGASGGALVASCLCMGLDPKAVFEDVLTVRPECARNPCRAFPCAEALLQRWMPANAAESLSNRIRVLTTRCSLKYPFVSAEVVNTFRDRQDCFHALRASCHIPLLAGWLPYKWDGHFYVDGLFWPQLLVPWKGNDDDYVIRVSAMVPGPKSDLRAPFPPTYWALLPPPVSVLRGLYWRGYKDAGSFFTGPPGEASPCFSCGTPVGEGSRRRSGCTGRRPSNPSNGAQGPEGEGEDQRQHRLLEIQKLLLKRPAGDALPAVDDAAGLSPEELIGIFEARMALERKVLGAMSVVVCLCVGCWVLVGWL